MRAAAKARAVKALAAVAALMFLLTALAVPLRPGAGEKRLGWTGWRGDTELDFTPLPHLEQVNEYNRAYVSMTVFHAENSAGGAFALADRFKKDGAYDTDLKITLSTADELYLFSRCANGYGAEQAAVDEAESRFYLGLHYVLADNIEVPAGYVYPYRPVGGAAGAPFAGAFDGQGFEITGLSFERNTDLFAHESGIAMFAANAGTIRGLGLVSPSIDSVRGNNLDVASLFVVNTGTVENCYVIEPAFTDTAVSRLYPFGKEGDAISCYVVTDLASPALTGLTVKTVGSVFSMAGDAWYDSDYTTHGGTLNGSYPRLAGAKWDGAGFSLYRPADIVYLPRLISAGLGGATFTIKNCIDMSGVSAYAYRPSAVPFTGTLTAAGYKQESCGAGGLPHNGAGAENATHALVNFRIAAENGTDSAAAETKLGMFLAGPGASALDVSFIGGGVTVPARSASHATDRNAAVSAGLLFAEVDAAAGAASLTGVFSSADVTALSAGTGQTAGGSLALGGLVGRIASGHVEAQYVSFSGIAAAGDAPLAVGGFAAVGGLVGALESGASLNVTRAVTAGETRGLRVSASGAASVYAGGSVGLIDGTAKFGYVAARGRVLSHAGSDVSYASVVSAGGVAGGGSGTASGGPLYRDEDGSGSALTAGAVTESASVSCGGLFGDLAVSSLSDSCNAGSVELATDRADTVVLAGLAAGEVIATGCANSAPLTVHIPAGGAIGSLTLTGLTYAGTLSGDNYGAISVTNEGEIATLTVAGVSYSAGRASANASFTNHANVTVVTTGGGAREKSTHVAGVTATGLVDYANGLAARVNAYDVAVRVTAGSGSAAHRLYVAGVVAGEGGTGSVNGAVYQGTISVSCADAATEVVAAGVSAAHATAGPRREMYRNAWGKMDAKGNFDTSLPRPAFSVANGFTAKSLTLAGVGYEATKFYNNRSFGTAVFGDSVTLAGDLLYAGMAGTVYHAETNLNSADVALSGTVLQCENVTLCGYLADSDMQAGFEAGLGLNPRLLNFANTGAVSFAPAAGSRVRGDLTISGAVGRYHASKPSYVALNNMVNAGPVSAEVSAVSGNVYAGGLAAVTAARVEGGTASFTNDANLASVVVTGAPGGAAYAGGVLGAAKDAALSGYKMTVSVSACVNGGSVSAPGGTAGGVIGLALSDGASVTVKLSTTVNYGEVSGGTAGGLAGRFSGTVAGNSLDCLINHGTVTGVSASGGILGRHTDGANSTLSALINYGEVSGGSAGGILGAGATAAKYTLQNVLQAAAGTIAGGTITASCANVSTVETAEPLAGVAVKTNDNGENGIYGADLFESVAALRMEVKANADPSSKAYIHSYRPAFGEGEEAKRYLYAVLSDTSKGVYLAKNVAYTSVDAGAGYRDSLWRTGTLAELGMSVDEAMLLMNQLSLSQLTDVTAMTLSSAADPAAITWPATVDTARRTLSFYLFDEEAVAASYYIRTAELSQGATLYANNKEFKPGDTAAWTIELAGAIPSDKPAATKKVTVKAEDRTVSADWTVNLYVLATHRYFSHETARVADGDPDTNATVSAEAAADGGTYTYGVELPFAEPYTVVTVKTYGYSARTDLSALFRLYALPNGQTPAESGTRVTEGFSLSNASVGPWSTSLTDGNIVGSMSFTLSLKGAESKLPAGWYALVLDNGRTETAGDTCLTYRFYLQENRAHELIGEALTAAMARSAPVALARDDTAHTLTADHAYGNLPDLSSLSAFLSGYALSENAALVFTEAALAEDADGLKRFSVTVEVRSEYCVERGDDPLAPGAAADKTVWTVLLTETAPVVEREVVRGSKTEQDPIRVQRDAAGGAFDVSYTGSGSAISWNDSAAGFRLRVLRMIDETSYTDITAGAISPEADPTVPKVTGRVVEQNVFRYRVAFQAKNPGAEYRFAAGYTPAGFDTSGWALPLATEDGEASAVTWRETELPVLVIYKEQSKQSFAPTARLSLTPSSASIVCVTPGHSHDDANDVLLSLSGDITYTDRVIPNTDVSGNANEDRCRSFSIVFRFDGEETPSVGFRLGLPQIGAGADSEEVGTLQQWNGSAWQTVDAHADAVLRVSETARFRIVAEDYTFVTEYEVFAGDVVPDKDITIRVEGDLDALFSVTLMTIRSSSGSFANGSASRLTTLFFLPGSGRTEYRLEKHIPAYYKVVVDLPAGYAFTLTSNISSGTGSVITPEGLVVLDLNEKMALSVTYTVTITKTGSAEKPWGDEDIWQSG